MFIQFITGGVHGSWHVGFIVIHAVALFLHGLSEVSVELGLFTLSC